ncbi:TetR/AcrR family transcriptional regulator [Pelotomaculum propionicicum]|uniref:HTH-type transcriptional regulator AcrR n=1 Tax=Pelotomaculum propionicicum TaxID=258475 RepID=A0A4Y7RVH8_9FIRM|nr:TetR/AcrR family transcriptional regulator [Pelotomaculum propionicicum]NLI12046.1 TetR/AcrR family transcriptional regulator [Peptococcaceae bacterium]TEB13004.1 HTH-type transcriptional regulator AcrR [Pelotomaculum propionicicum]
MEQIRRNRTEKKKEETRKRIVSIAIELFNRQGFDRTTVEQIAEEADVARGTIFNHFPVKEAIVHAYVQTALRDTGSEAINKLARLPDIRSRLTVLLRHSLQWFEQNLRADVLEKYMVYMMQRAFETLKDQALRSGFNNILIPVLGEGQSAGEIRRDIPAEELANHLEWLSASMIILWLACPEKSAAEIIDREIDLFLSGAAGGSAQNK